MITSPTAGATICAKRQTKRRRGVSPDPMFGTIPAINVSRNDIDDRRAQRTAQ